MSYVPNQPIPPAPPGPTIPEAPAHLVPAPARAPEPLPQPSPAKRRKRWPFVLLGVGLAIVAIVLVAWGPVTRAITIREARAHGILLGDEIGAIEVGWGEVTVRDYTFELDDVEGVTGKGKELTVELDGLTAASLTAHEVELELVGSAAVLAVAISEWTGEHPELVRIPTKADEVAVSWQESASGPVWLRIRGGSIEPLKNGAKLDGRASVFGLPLGGVGAVWKGNKAKVELGFGRSDSDEAPIHIEVTELKTKPKAKIALRPTSLASLSGPLGVLLPIGGVTVSGDAVMQYKGKKNAPIAGTVEAKLDGYRPPVPREAQGFVFGDTTTLSTDVEISADRKTVSLTKTKVKHGAIELDGEGSISRGSTHAAIEMKLSGKVSCAALAKAAIKGGMGATLGPMAEQLASGAVKGSVEIRLVISADTRNLLGTKIERHLGVGCGIRWPELPPVPEGFPQIPNIPGLPPLKL